MHACACAYALCVHVHACANLLRARLRARVCVQVQVCVRVRACMRVHGCIMRIHRGHACLYSNLQERTGTRDCR